ncbi:MAG: leucyl/phenylalanyl-tRNA--protein transferase [Acidobacteriota bacterium]
MIDPALLVRAYREGIFPMALEDGEIGWFSPDPRGILPLDTFHVPSRLRRLSRQELFSIRIDHDFAGVMRACAAGRAEGTWISDEILDSYVALFERGMAHSVETWFDDTLVGGLYGVHLGGAFFGESMFHRKTDASKVALVALVERLKRQKFTLLDVQWTNPHLDRFGAIAIPRTRYMRMLRDALERTCVFGADEGSGLER